MEIIVKRLDGTEDIIIVKNLTEEELESKKNKLIKNLTKKYNINEEETKIIHLKDNLFVEEEVEVEEEDFDIVEAKAEVTTPEDEIVKVLKSINDSNKEMVLNMKNLPVPQDLLLQDSEVIQTQMQEFRESFLNEISGTKDIIVNINDSLEKNNTNSVHLLKELERISSNSKKDNIIDKVISILNIIIVIVLITVLIIALGN